jgi:serine/threonine protein kinase
MGEQSQLEELLSLWDLGRAEGRTVTAQELCVGHPELLVPLQRRIEEVLRLEQLKRGVQRATLASTINANAASGGLPVACVPTSPPLEETSFLTTPGGELDLRGYELIEQLGTGGMGEVYRCCDPALERDLAIKVMKASLRDDPEGERRFLREARVTGSLQHPGIVPVHNLGRLADGHLHYTMRLVRGRTFADILKQEAGKPERLSALLAIFQKVCEAVAYAHSKRVIHRDLKPSNIMVGRFGEVQVMDWGLAKVLSPDEGPDSPEEKADAAGTSIPTESIDTPVDLTRTGSGMGTPAYMPPEQALGEWDTVDERADVFALGSILCEMLTGQPPYVGEDGNEVRRRARRGDLADALARVQRCGADVALWALCRACLAPERESRPRDASVVARCVADYEAEAQERLRWAELERAQAHVRRAEWERARLCAALILLTPSLIFLVRDLLDTNLPLEVASFGRLFHGTVAVVALVVTLVVAWVLWRRKQLSLSTLRGVDLAILGSMTLFFGWLQYRDFVHGPIAEASGVEQGPLVLKHAIGSSATRWFFLILMYGIFISSTWRRCLLVSLGLAITPLILTPLAASRHAPLEGEFFFSMLDMVTLLALAIAIVVFNSRRMEIISRPAARRSGWAATAAGPESNPSGSRPPAGL